MDQAQSHLRRLHLKRLPQQVPHSLTHSLTSPLSMRRMQSLQLPMAAVSAHAVSHLHPQALQRLQQLLEKPRMRLVSKARQPDHRRLRPFGRLLHRQLRRWIRSQRCGRAKLQPPRRASPVARLAWLLLQGHQRDQSPRRPLVPLPLHLHRPQRLQQLRLPQARLTMHRQPRQRQRRKRQLQLLARTLQLLLVPLSMSQRQKLTRQTRSQPLLW